MKKLKKFLTILTLVVFTFTFSACSEKADPVIEYDLNLSRELINESIDLGTRFMLNNQKPAGNFTYEYDFVTKEFTPGDNQVRQAGALWGLTLLHRENPSEETRQAIIKGFEFFDKNSIETFAGKWTTYPDESKGRSGTVALVSLALTEFLQSELALENRQQYEEDLDRYINFLLSLRLTNGQFFSSYDLENGAGQDAPSPYFDGEILLALSKYAKFKPEEGEKLHDLILESAENMYEENVTKALKEDEDSDTTKGFYQWASMSFYEIYTSDWGNDKKWADRAIELAYWMIDTHETLYRTRNTGYAYEGLASAWELARLRKNQEALNKIGEVVDKGLYKLTSWQVGSPIQNSYLQENPTTDPLALGGIMNKSSGEPTLRIDTTQHQMHALILARRYIYQLANTATEE